MGIASGLSRRALGLLLANAFSAESFTDVYEDSLFRGIPSTDRRGLRYGYSHTYVRDR